MTIPQHSSKTNEHYTPAIIVQPARQLLGGIDLDPASCARANVSIRAGTYYDKRDDGLSRPWFGTVFLNPPGGLLRRGPAGWRAVRGGPGESSMQVWWNYLVSQWLAVGRVGAAFFVGFTLEILRLSQQGLMPVQAFPRCYPKSRLRFRGTSPTHANVLVYLPPKLLAKEEAFSRFENLFGPIGLCEPGAIWKSKGADDEQLRQQESRGLEQADRRREGAADPGGEGDRRDQGQREEQQVLRVRARR